MRRERMIPPFPSHGRTRPAFSCDIPPNVLFPPHVRTSPKPTGKSCVFPSNSASATHDAACHGNGLFPCAWELTHGCPWLRSTAFHVPVRAGTRSAAKKRNAPRTKNFRMRGARCHAQRLSPLHNKVPLAGSARKLCNAVRGRKHASPRETAPTYARKWCL